MTPPTPADKKAGDVLNLLEGLRSALVTALGAANESLQAAHHQRQGLEAAIEAVDHLCDVVRDQP